MKSIIVNETSINGVTLTELRHIADNRGAILHMLRSDSPGFIRFGECYFAESLPGATKAWKRHHFQTQNLAVPVGRIRIVIYDDRPESITQGKLQELELGRPDAYFLLRIPLGLWYGFRCISATPALLANCADLPHDSTESDLRFMDDSRIPYRW